MEDIAIYIIDGNLAHFNEVFYRQPITRVLRALNHKNELMRREVILHGGKVENG